MNSAHEQSHKDMIYFLKLALAQLESRRALIARQPESETLSDFQSRVNKCRMLEELIREQVPDEDSRNSARSPR